MRKIVPVLLDKRNDKMFIVNQYLDTDPTFKMTITVTASETFTLALNNTGTYNFTCDWGDGSALSTITAYNDADREHTYTNAGDYQLKIVGQMPYLRFNNAGDRLNVKSIDQWGSVGATSMAGTFYGCTNLESIPNTKIGWTNVTSCYQAFYNCSSLTTTPDNLFEGFSNCTTFSYCFRGCTTLTEIGTDLFKGCSSVTTYSLCFYQCYALTSIPTDLFRDSVNVTSFASCFAECNNIDGTLPTDLFRYNTAVTAFANVFLNCTKVDGIPENFFYYNSSVTTYNSAFKNCRNMSLPSVIFNLSNLSIVTDFTSFMYSTSTGYSSTGTIQDIWNYCTGTSTTCFTNQTSLTNYASIPAAWR